MSDNIVNLRDPAEAPWRNDPRLKERWMISTFETDQAARCAGATSYDLIAAHMGRVKELGQWDAEEFRKVLQIWGDPHA